MKIFGKLRYYISQAEMNLKRSYLILITFSICFSMIAGLSLGADSFQSFLYKEELSNYGGIEFFDLRLEFERPEEIYDDKINQNIREVMATTVIDEAEKTKMGQIYLSNDYKFNINVSESDLNSNFSYPEVYEGDVQLILGNHESYDLLTINDEGLSIINGSLPSTPDEIMVDWLFAQYYDLNLNEFNTFYVTKYYEEEKTKVELGCYNVTGFFNIRSHSEIFGYSYSTYFQDPESGEYKVYEYYQERQKVYQQVPIFGYQEFHNNSIKNVVYEDLIKLPNVYYLERSAYFIRFNFADIPFNQIESHVNAIFDDISVIENRFYNTLQVETGWRLEDIRYSLHNFKFIQYILQAINLPLLIFSIIMGSISIKNETQNRMEEYLLLRSKGTPGKTITRQLLFESVVLGFFAAVFGTILGFPVFYGIRGIFSSLFGFYSDLSLPLIFSWEPFLLNLIIGIISVLLSTISSIFIVKRLPAHKILEHLGQGSMGLTYSEKTLFDNDKANTFFKKENEKTQESLSPSDKRKKRRQERKIQRYYKKNVDDSKGNFFLSPIGRFLKARNIISIIFIGIAFIPILLLLFGFWGQSDNPPNFVLNIYEIVGDGFIFIGFLMILTPFFLTIGLIRRIGVEKPHILAKIGQKVTQPILGKVSKLLGMENIRRKEYITITNVMGVFIGLIVFINIFIYSSLNIAVVESNIPAGADLNLDYEPNQGSINGYEQLSNLTEFKIHELEETIKNITNLNNESVVNDVLTIYVESGRFLYSNGISRSGNTALVFTNITKLIHMITEGGKNSIGEVETYLEELAQNPQGEYPNCIISRRLAEYEDIEEFGKINLPHFYYDELLEESESDPFVAKAIHIADYIPGLWNYRLFLYEYRYIENIALFDESILNTLDYNLCNFTIGNLVDLKDDFRLDLNETNHILSQISEITNVYGWTVDEQGVYVEDFYQLQDLMETPSIASLNYAFILEFGMIGLVLALGLGILMISFQKNNKYFNGILLARGYGRRGLLKFVISLILMLFTVALVTGGTIGSLSAIFGFKLFTSLKGVTSFPGLIPISINWTALLSVVAIIPATSLLLYFTNFVAESKKPVSAYFRKF